MKSSLKKRLKAIANIPQDRVFYDVPDDLAEEMFDIYDPVDLYIYLTKREQNQAYKDMRGIGANSKQIQMEWKKKAIWRLAKNGDFDCLEELEESKSGRETMLDVTNMILSGVPVREALSITVKDPATGKYFDIEADPWKNAKNETVLNKDVIKKIISKVVTNNRKYLESYSCQIEDLIENKKGNFIVLEFLTADDTSFYDQKEFSKRFLEMVYDVKNAFEKEFGKDNVWITSMKYGENKIVHSPCVYVTYEVQ